MNRTVEISLSDYEHKLRMVFMEHVYESLPIVRAEHPYLGSVGELHDQCNYIFDWILNGKLPSQ